MKYSILFCLIAGPVLADPFNVHTTAQALFERLPEIVETSDFYDACGGAASSNPNIGYCATGNTIFIRENFSTRPQASYEMAHILGHAIQVRHGVADVALREIRTRRSEESKLRGMVTRQVECVAGVLMARAGEPAANLGALFGAEPFTVAHWGRNPLRSGPRVSIGLAARQDWYDIGYEAQNFSVCSVEEMSSQLIVEALR